MFLVFFACHRETPPDVSETTPVPVPAPQPQPQPQPEPTGTTGTTAETGAAPCVEGQVAGPTWPKPCDELCLPADQVLAVTAAAPIPCFTALGQPCAGQTDEGGYIYAIPGLPRMELVLLPGVAGGFDASWFSAAFGVATVYVPLGEVAPGGPSFVHTHRFEEPSLFAFADGRVTADLTFDADTAELNWIGYDPDCQYLDYYWDCTCDYQGFSVPVELTIDVVLADPTGP